MTSLRGYLLGIWAARYFWVHLAMSDLRSRWRRSFFGILWSILQPLGMTLLIVLVLSKLFNQEVRTFAPYILSGVIVWEFFSTAIVSGSVSLVHAESYIKQTRHPLAIYTLRTCVSALVVMALASIALIGWILIALPERISVTWLAVPTVFPVILLMVWPLSTIMGYVGARYRDLPNALALILQAAWFVSPVYFPETMFRSGGLQGLVEYNPIYHLLQIVRAPLLHGEWPSATNYIWCLGTFVVGALLAVAVGRRSEKQVIFYL